LPQRALEARQRDRARRIGAVDRGARALELAPLERARAEVGEQNARRAGERIGQIEQPDLGLDRITDRHILVGRRPRRVRRRQRDREQPARPPAPPPSRRRRACVRHRAAC